MTLYVRVSVTMKSLAAFIFVKLDDPRRNGRWKCSFFRPRTKLPQLPGRSVYMSVDSNVGREKGAGSCLPEKKVFYNSIMFPSSKQQLPESSIRKFLSIGTTNNGFFSRFSRYYRVNHLQIALCSSVPCSAMITGGTAITPPSNSTCALSSPFGP